MEAISQEEQVLLDQADDAPRLRELMCEARSRGFDLEAFLEGVLAQQANII